MTDSWALSALWNSSLDVDRQRELVQRDYIYASELGASFYDRYWKMKARKPTTPPNSRAQRKFEAGNLTEWVVKQILIRAHVLQSAQLPIIDEDTPLPVHGRCDFIAGGVPEMVSLEDLPEVLAEVSEATIEMLKKKYPKGLAKQGLEVKSCAATMFDRYEKAPSLQHGLQAYHYAHVMGIPYHLIYLCRDDLRMVEYVILPEAERWDRLYQEDIKTMAEVIKLSEREIEDWKEPLLAYDPLTHRFSKNWKVEYSNYLTDYGYERSDLYGDYAAGMGRRANTITKNIVAGKKLSKVNLASKEMITAFYPEAEEVFTKLRQEFPELEEVKK